MTLKEALIQGVKSQNLETVSRVVDQLRFRCGKNYAQIAALAEQWAGIGADEWEELMYECDTYVG